jgi:hypothetical protein
MASNTAHDRNRATAFILAPGILEAVQIGGARRERRAERVVRIQRRQIAAGTYGAIVLPSASLRLPSLPYAG